MSNQFLDHRPRRRVLPFLLLAVVGLLVFVAVGVAIESGSGPHGPRSYAPPAAIPPPGSVTGVNPGGSPAPGDTGPLQLIQGDKLINGVSVGYPHSMIGAVSAAVEYWRQIGSTLDPDRAAAVGRLIADPSWSAAPQQLAVGPISARKALGLAVDGPVPAGASVILAPVEYQLRSTSADNVQVLLLATYTTSSPSQEPQTRMGVYPLQLHWAASGDWKIPAPSGSDTTDYSSLVAEPGSVQASAYGWQELKQ